MHTLSKNGWFYYNIAYFLYMVFLTVKGELVIKPESTTVVKGGTVVFHCKSGLPDSVQWKIVTKDGSVGSLVNITNGNRYSVSYCDNLGASQNLVISNVTFDDARWYTCEEKNPIGGAVFELIVIGEYLSTKVILSLFILK